MRQQCNGVNSLEYGSVLEDLHLEQQHSPILSKFNKNRNFKNIFFIFVICTIRVS